MRPFVVRGHKSAGGHKARFYGEDVRFPVGPTIGRPFVVRGHKSTGDHKGRPYFVSSSRVWVKT